VRGKCVKCGGGGIRPKRVALVHVFPVIAKNSFGEYIAVYTVGRGVICPKLTWLERGCLGPTREWRHLREGFG